MRHPKEYYQLKKDLKTLHDGPHIRLRTKIKFGGNVGSFAMRKLMDRDMEMNREAYMASKKEQDEIRARKLTKCPICFRSKPKWYRICYPCLMKKRNQGIV